jgi:CBS domain-containing protein
MTAIVFTVEQTHDWNMLLPLLIGCVVSYAVSTLLLKRSILTEKVARRGYHLSAEYAVDPLELLYVREVMRTNVVALPANALLREVEQSFRGDHRQAQRLLPVVDAQGVLQGVVTRAELRHFAAEQHLSGDVQLGSIATQAKTESYPDEPLRVAVYRMAENGVTRMPVVERDTRRLLGLVSLEDLLKARSRHLEEERRREQIIRWRYFRPTGTTTKVPADVA